MSVHPDGNLQVIFPYRRTNHSIDITINIVIYSTTKEIHQSLLGPIMEIRIKKLKYIYTIFRSNQFGIISLNNVTVLLKPVHAVCHCLDKGSFSKMTSFSLENEHLVLV